MQLPLSRRSVLRGIAGLGAVAGAGPVLAGCGGEEDLSRSVVEPDDPVIAFVNEALGTDLGPADFTLNVVFASFEVLTGQGARVPFALFDIDRVAPEPTDARAWLVAESSRTVVAGDLPATFHAENLAERGVYVARADLQEAGLHLLVVEKDDEYGFGLVQVRAPQDSTVPTPGETLAALETPTFDDDMGLERLCTNTPPCPMHERSFAAVRAAGRPAVVSVATPAFCTSAICAPTVELLTGLREDIGTEDLDWIHVEVFTDAGETPAPWVGADGWHLPTEPWTFVVRADGTIVDRFDGPLIASFLREAVDRATA